ncbi:MAG: hypothetical protein HC880_16420, partial [Bacteroidia bacterium]|nr:hypothetical protein [Bacteroidia bacterium]
MTISEIKARLSLLDLLGYYGQRVGRNHRMCCPFHEDKTPSLQLYPETNTAYCFAATCPTNGRRLSVIDWVKHQEKLASDREAILRCKAIIKEIYGEHNFQTSKQMEQEKQDQTPTPLKPEARAETLEKAFGYFKNGCPRCPEAMAYLAGRHLAGKGLD